MAMVGYLLLRWGEVERLLDGKRLPPSLGHLQQRRNQLCHGMVSASAPPGQEPFVVTSSDGEMVTHTYTDLDDAIRELEGLIRSATLLG